ncbi:MAG TPA: hypothetical protein VJU61_15325 [Polyangiaceae bacterium]|nr:hypothetical protein [Polyangiaceae bacterium]
MNSSRWWKVLAGPEFGLLTTLLFAALYVWPFLTFDRLGSTFRFMFAVWAAHILIILATSYASNRLERLAGGSELGSSLPPHS